jgi:hypothetical protein
MPLLSLQPAQGACHISYVNYCRQLFYALALRERVCFTIPNSKRLRFQGNFKGIEFEAFKGNVASKQVGLLFRSSQNNLGAAAVTHLPQVQYYRTNS